MNIFGKKLIFADNAIGDTLMMLPTLRALNVIFEGELRLLSNPKYYRTTFFEFDKQAIQWENYSEEGDYKFPDKEFIMPLVEDSSQFISLCTWHTKCNTPILKNSNSLGFNKELFSHYLSISKDTHAIDSYFNIAKHYDDDLEVEKFIGAVSISQKYEKHAFNAFSQLKKEYKVLGFHTYSRAEKTWNNKHAVEVLNDFLNKNQDWVVLNLDPFPNKAFSKLADGRHFSLFGLPLELFLASLNNCDAFIGVDSCFLHAADIAGIPGVGLFGATDPQQWGFRFTNHIHVCSGDMSLLSKPQILDALKSIVDQLSKTNQTHS